MAEFLGGQSALQTLDQASVYGAKPQQRDDVVPGQQEKQDFAQEIESAPVPNMEEFGAPDMEEAEVAVSDEFGA